MPADKINKTLMVPDAVKSVDVENRSVTAMLSTPTIDRDGEIIEPKAYTGSLPDFAKNPIMLWMHRHDQPIGSWSNLKITDAGLQGTAKFAKTALAEDIWQLYRDGHVKGFSVGFGVRKHERRTVNGRSVTAFTEVALYEVSAVTIPANPEALARSMMPGGEDISKLIQTAVNAAVKETLGKQLAAEPGGPLCVLIQDILDAQGLTLTGGKCACGAGGDVPPADDPAVASTNEAELKALREVLRSAGV